MALIELEDIEAPCPVLGPPLTTGCGPAYSYLQLWAIKMATEAAAHDSKALARAIARICEAICLVLLESRSSERPLVLIPYSRLSETS